ncbi:MAG: redox-sensing transcriptional repressor Rex [Oscillospiraceae bacterium]|nr:redox-sensing transcriptional repressor Rex [Oscillospiraceae bacterium]
MKKPYISKNVIQRMPRYLRTLTELQKEGTNRVSSGELGARLGLTPSQIRQDFSCFGGFGQQGYGYNVKTLRDEIAAILGMDRGYQMILVGTGKIGQSLLENFDFESCGFTLRAAFDIRHDLIGEDICGVPVLDCSEMEDFIRNNGIHVAVLSTTRGGAQRVADALIAGGIRAIWNFTECELSPGDSDVIIESIHFSESLLRMSYHLSNGASA